MSNWDLTPAIHQKANELAVLQFAQNYLVARGWNREGIVDGQNNPIPWYTYPAIEFLSTIVRKEWRVLEYGCGYSTLFWKAHVKQVVSVEHNAAFAESLRKLDGDLDIRVRAINAPHPNSFDRYLADFRARNFDLPLSPDAAHNAEHGLLNEPFAAYVAEATTFDAGYFDVIVADGMARALSLFTASQLIAPDGIVILDNSDRWQYNAALRWMAEKGFARIDFFGPGAHNRFGWGTSIFSRSIEPLQPVVTDRPAKHGDLGW